MSRTQCAGLVAVLFSAFTAVAGLTAIPNERCLNDGVGITRADGRTPRPLRDGPVRTTNVDNLVRTVIEMNPPEKEP